MPDRRDQLRLLDEWRRLYQQGRSDGSPECPSDEQLAALATGETRGEERVRLGDHVVSCRRCSETYRTLRELDREASAGRPRASGRRLAWALAAAASVLLAAWLVGPRWRARPGTPGPDAGPDVVRSGREAPGARPASGARLAAPPQELAWSARPGSTGYRVRLFDAAAEPLWERGGLRLPRVAVPEAIRSRLVPGASYFWVVEIEGPPGGERLGPYWFRVAGPR